MSGVFVEGLALIKRAATRLDEVVIDGGYGLFRRLRARSGRRRQVARDDRMQPLL